MLYAYAGGLPPPRFILRISYFILHTSYFTLHTVYFIQAELPSRDRTLCAALLRLEVDLSVAPFRARLYRVGGAPAFLALSTHHVVMDGLSQQVAFRHLASSYILYTLCLCFMLLS